MDKISFWATEMWNWVVVMFVRLSILKTTELWGRLEFLKAWWLGSKGTHLERAQPRQKLHCHFVYSPKSHTLSLSVVEAIRVPPKFQRKGINHLLMVLEGHRTGSIALAIFGKYNLSQTSFSFYVHTALFFKKIFFNIKKYK